MKELIIIKVAIKINTYKNKTKTPLTSAGLVRAAFSMCPLLRPLVMGDVIGGDVSGVEIGMGREVANDVVPAIMIGSSPTFLSGELLPCFICPFFLFFFLYFTYGEKGCLHVSKGRGKVL